MDFKLFIVRKLIIDIGGEIDGEKPEIVANR